MHAPNPPSFMYPAFRQYPALPLPSPLTLTTQTGIYSGFPPVFSPVQRVLMNPSTYRFLPMVQGQLPSAPPSDIPLDLTMKKRRKSYDSDAENIPIKRSPSNTTAETTSKKMPLSISNRNDGNITGKPTCQICNKTFTTRANLNVHGRVHTGEKPYECPHCGKKFSQNPSLRAHLRTHTGEKPFKCAVCSRAFSDYSTWQKHYRLHSGEKPYVCEVCGKGFAQSGNLIRHRRSRHADAKGKEQ